MRILQVIPYFPPAYAFGGPVKVAYQMCTELAKRGHDVTVFTSDAKDLTSRLDVERATVLDGVKVYYFRNISMVPVKWLKLFITPQLLSVAKVRTNNFDVIHLHEYRTFQNIITKRYARKHKVPYILEAHGSLPTTTSKEALKSIYDVFFGNSLLMNASKVIALTRTEALQYTEKGVPEKNVAIIPNGIDLTEYDNLPAKGNFKDKFNIPRERRVVLYVGRIHETKRIDLLVKAFGHLIKKMNYGNVVLVIAGPDEGYMAEIKSLADSLGVSKSVIFPGFISNEDRNGALMDADVFVTPSFNGFPMTFLEACAMGTPIVTTRLGDSLEWIDNNAGFVTPSTSSDLAEAISRIISDDKLRRRFSMNCRTIIRSEFSLEKVVKKTEQVYREVTCE